MKRDNENYESDYVFDNAFAAAENMFEEQETLFPGITDREKKVVSEPVRGKKILNVEKSQKEEQKIEEFFPRHEEEKLNDTEELKSNYYEDEIFDDEEPEYIEEDDMNISSTIEENQKQENYEEDYLDEIEPKEYEGDLDNSTKTEEYHVHIEDVEKKVETFDNQTVTQLSEPKKNNKSKLILIILSLFGIVILGYIAFYFLKIDSKYVLVKSIDYFTESLEKVMSPTKRFVTFQMKDDFSLKGTLNINIDTPLVNVVEETDEESQKMITLIENLNDVSFDVDTRINATQKKGYINFLTKLKEENVLDIFYINQDKKQYVFFKDVFEQYIKLDEELDIFKEIGKDDQELKEEIEYVFCFIKDSFEKNMKASYTETKNEELEIDGEKVKTTKVTLILNDANYTELFSNIVKDIKADERANQIILKLYPDFESYEVTSSGSDKVFYYSVNVTKVAGKVAKISLYDEENVFTITIGKNKVFEFNENGKGNIRATLSETNDGFSFLIEDLANSVNKVEITGTTENEKIVYGLTVMTEEVKVESTLTSTIDEITAGEEYKVNSELLLSAIYQGVKLGTITFSSNIEIRKGAEIEEIVDFISEDTLTEEDEKKLETYMEDVLKKIFPYFEEYLEDVD